MKGSKDAMASPTSDRKRSLELDRDDSEGHSQQQDSKRKSMDGVSQDGPESSAQKKKRRKVNHACVYCRRSHMTCDLERPCARCVKRDIGHLCHDEPRDPPKRSKSEVAELAPAGEDSLSPRELAPANGSISYSSQGNGDIASLQQHDSSSSGPQLAQPTPLSPVQLQNPGGRNNSFMGYDWNNSGAQNQFQDMHHLHPNYMFNTSEVTNEYNLLNDFLSTSLLDDGGLYSNDDAQVLFNDPLLSTSSMGALANDMPAANASATTQMLGPPPQTAAGNEISRPSSARPVDAKARDKFYMTAADPSGNSSAEDRMNKLLKAKYDAGMLKPFNYVKGYARLNQYMEKHLLPQSRSRILRCLEKFRPKFREAMHALSDLQLVMVEMWFERSLMEYDRVFASMAIPACCWRRTGEIFRGNREMAELIHVPMEKLRDVSQSPWRFALLTSSRRRTTVADA